MHRAPELRRQFQDLVYGAYPDADPVEVASRHILDPSPIPGAGAFEDVRLRLSGSGREFSVTYALPEGKGPFPTVIHISFCGNKAAFGGREGIYAPASLPAFCKQPDSASPDDPDPYLSALPLDLLLSHGYAVVSIQPGEVIPDNPEEAEPILQELSGNAPPESRTGTILAWGWVVSRAIDYLDTDERLDAHRTALMGHSRNGKAAFAAAIFDPRIDLLWAHQSGTAGVTLFKTYEGESIENITGGFPHWLAPKLREYAGREEDLPLDQDEAVALLAPRPVLAGAAYDDTWAGPAGAFQSLLGAAPVYRRFSGTRISLPSMEETDLRSDLAYFIRPGRHGTALSDWKTFVAFLDIHFRSGPAAE